MIDYGEKDVFLCVSEREMDIEYRNFDVTMLQ